MGSLLGDSDIEMQYSDDEDENFQKDNDVPTADNGNEVEPEEELSDLFGEETITETDLQKFIDSDVVIQQSCNCQRRCWEKFPEDDVMDSRMAALEMRYTCGDHINHHHLFIKGALNSLLRTSTKTMKLGHQSVDRKQTYTEFMFRGVAVCQLFFQYVNGANIKEFRNIRSGFLKNGPEVLQHGNAKVMPKPKYISLGTWEYTVRFIKAFGIQHGVILPGRAPMYRQFKNLILLPSTFSKMQVYQLYKAACEKKKIQFIGISRWYSIWEELCSNIVIQKPRSDLCSTCQLSITSLSQLQNLPEEEKMAKIEQSRDHLDLVKNERDYYRERINECKKMIPKKLQTATPQPCRSLSYRGALHYSFDYAQQVHLPFDSQQIGPLYFLTGYKVGLFGVAIEPLEHFVLFVIPEACNVSKGASSIISFLHYTLENFSLGESCLQLHADNCVGQNKNRFVLDYISWRVLQGLNDEVSLSFLPVGHTKFAPDAHFGHFKSAWVKSSCHTLKELCQVASGVKNTSVILVGNEQGDIFIDQYDWTGYFDNQNLKKVPCISQQQHFWTLVDDVGVMKYSKTIPKPDNSNVKTVEIYSDEWTNDYPTFPNSVDPIGLSIERKNYLYKKIRPFVRPECKNTLCPKPIIEKPIVNK